MRKRRAGKHFQAATRGCQAPLWRERHFGPGSSETCWPKRQAARVVTLCPGSSHGPHRAMEAGKAHLHNQGRKAGGRLKSEKRG